MIFLTLFLLVVMEISLSFDNAVLNAKTLGGMSPVWQKRFLTWGILVAVFGMRLFFPIGIVSMATHLSLLEVFNIALYRPEEYAQHLSAAHVTIAAFGGFFLLMIFLKFLFDSAKETHWLKPIEETACSLGKMEAIEICIALTTILIMQHFVPAKHHLEFILSGIVGILVYVFVDGIMELFSSEDKTVVNGITGLIYLEILDASCSLDGVIGAFVLTDNIILIMIGLGIGALIIRSLTLYLVKGGTLKEYIYLEHGANYGIGALAIIMLTNIFYAVPEPVTGMIGIGFIGLSLLSSIKHKGEQNDNN